MEETQRNSSSLELYYAVNGTGQGMVYVGRPYRDDHFKCWLGHVVGCISMVVSLFEADGFELPPLKWSDEPIKLSLTLAK